jgi:N-acetylneuraminate synthase
VSQVEAVDRREKIYCIVKRAKDTIRQAGVVIPGQADFEISHHYGVDRFEETGATLISLVNREYCKKLIVVLPGQRHPEHYHKRKEETFLVIHGRITIVLNGERKELTRGDVLVVERCARHSFQSDIGCIMEELSTTHYPDDSFYTDPAIAPVEERKTSITYWLDAESSATPTGNATC